MGEEGCGEIERAAIGAGLSWGSDENAVKITTVTKKH